MDFSNISKKHRETLTYMEGMMDAYVAQRTKYNHGVAEKSSDVPYYSFTFQATECDIVTQCELNRRFVAKGFKRVTSNYDATFKTTYYYLYL